MRDGHKSIPKAIPCLYHGPEELVSWEKGSKHFCPKDTGENLVPLRKRNSPGEQARKSTGLKTTVRNWAIEW